MLGDAEADHIGGPGHILNDAGQLGNGELAEGCVELIRGARVIGKLRVKTLGIQDV
jgi:hypothetical protein